MNWQKINAYGIQIDYRTYDCPELDPWRTQHEAVRHGDREFAEFLRAAFDKEDDPAAAIVACTRDLANGLRESGWLDGCPVTTTALESAGRAPEIQQAAEDAAPTGRLRRHSVQQLL
ncbi:hypothetical protein [Nonomuraea sp. NPDC003804]|uniref:LmrA/YxaF family transcription factor n=1 Tax=Nonomuraea sp. NPDC003804 TaxID=3154547 RepID=UPI0033A82D1B